MQEYCEQMKIHTLVANNKFTQTCTALMKINISIHFQQLN